MKEEVYIEAPRPDIRKSRSFRRVAPLGMKVWRSMTINFDTPHVVEHIEIGCPNYKLTDRGPVYDIKEQAE